jgi:hypothetical protein
VALTDDVPHEDGECVPLDEIELEDEEVGGEDGHEAEPDTVVLTLTLKDEEAVDTAVWEPLDVGNTEADEKDVLESSNAVPVMVADSESEADGVKLVKALADSR